MGTGLRSWHKAQSLAAILTASLQRYSATALQEISVITGTDDDPGNLRGGVVHAPADLATTGFDGTGLLVARVTQTVAQAAGGAAKQFSQVSL